MLEKLVSILPKLRNHFGLIGLIVTVGGFVATRQIAPESLNAQVAAGAVGGTFIVFGQIFYFLKDIPAKDRARFIILMFLMFCTFIISLIVTAAHFASAATTKLSTVELRAEANDDNAPANTLDDLVLTWQHEGPDIELDVVLTHSTTGARARANRIRASDHRLRLRSSDLKALWPHPALRESYPVRVEFQGKEGVYRFRPYDVLVAVRILFFYDSGALTVASLTDDQNRISHNFSVKCVAWPRPAGSNSRPESVDISAVDRRRQGNGCLSAPVRARALHNQMRVSGILSHRTGAV